MSPTVCTQGPLPHALLIASPNLHPLVQCSLSLVFSISHAESPHAAYIGPHLCCPPVQSNSLTDVPGVCAAAKFFWFLLFMFLTLLYFIYSVTDVLVCVLQPSSSGSCCSCSSLCSTSPTMGWPVWPSPQTSWWLPSSLEPSTAS